MCWNLSSLFGPNGWTDPCQRVQMVEHYTLILEASIIWDLGIGFRTFTYSSISQYIAVIHDRLVCTVDTYQIMQRFSSTPQCALSRWS
jgi:hypothetical protein